MNLMNPKVDFYFHKEEKWHCEIELLRTLVFDCGLKEELKWGCPCYTLDQSNIVLIHVFKHYCALLFFKGALLKNSENILVQQTKNVQAARQLRFTEVDEIKNNAATIKAYVYEAIEVEKAGLQVVLKQTDDFDKAEEFQHHLDQNSNLKKAFETLSPGRQRAYHLYFSAPKGAKTREARVQKYIPYILDGKGLHDER